MVWLSGRFDRLRTDIARPTLATNNSAQFTQILRACAGIAARKASFTSIHTLPGCFACNGRFGGSPFDLMMPVVAVIGIFAKETGQGMVFQVVIHCANTHRIGAPRPARLYSVARGGKPPARQDAGHQDDELKLLEALVGQLPPFMKG